MTNAHFEYEGSNLAAALVAFQAEPPKVEKDSYNPAFKSNFTSLEELTNKAFPALNKHGLAYTVTSEITEKGMAVVGTLLHTSGERLSASFPVTETNPQKIGSVFTYARRYLLAALTGIVVDADDDGNAASNPTATERQLDRARTPAAPTVSRGKTTADQDKIRVNYIESGKMTPDEVNNRFKAIEAKNAGKSRAEIFSLLLKELEAE